jgi:hypothetical protein
MTVKGIAEAVGRDESNVRRWIKKISKLQNAVMNEVLTGEMPVRNEVLDDKMSLRNSIAEKAEHSSPENPADYTLEEVSLIVEAGLGKNAAGIFRANLGMAAELAQIKGKLLDYNGFRADFQKFLESGNQKALPDPKEAAYQELENFVERTMEVDLGRIHGPYQVRELYHAYEKEAQNPMGKHEFMFTIALKHPEFELKFYKKEWCFTRCYVRRII